MNANIQYNGGGVAHNSVHCSVALSPHTQGQQASRSVIQSYEEITTTTSAEVES